MGAEFSCRDMHLRHTRNYCGDEELSLREYTISRPVSLDLWVEDTYQPVEECGFLCGQAVGGEE